MFDEVFVDAEGEERRRGIEDGIEGTEDGSCDDGCEKAGEPFRQDVAHEHSVGTIREIDFSGVKVQCDDPGQDQDHRGEQFEATGDEHPALSFCEILCGEGALDDLLVRGPIEEIEQDHPAE